MQKKMISICCITICMFSLVACAKTPKEAIVVDKSEGLPKECIIPEDYDTPKDLEIPNHWKETIEKSDKYVTVEADYNMKIEDIYNTPVYVYEMASLDNKLLKKLCNYFSNGNNLYEQPQMTKGELEIQKNQMTNRSGIWGSYENAAIRAMTERVDELIKNAPKENNYKYIEAELVEPRQTEIEYVKSASGYTADMNSEYYYDTNEKIGITARVDKGKEINPSIRAINYNNKLGSTSNFLFSQGTYIDEKWIKNALNNQEIFELGDEKYNHYLKQLQKEMSFDDTIYSKDKALSEIDELMKKLELKGYAVTDCFKAIGNSESEDWACLDDENATNIVGYSVYLAPEIGDVIGYEQPFQRPFSELPETTYAPAFSTEKIHIIITKEGIQRFEWTNMSKKVDEIAENTKLLSFGEIKEKMTDHLLYTIISKYGEENKVSGDQIHFEVKDVKFRAANIPAYEKPSAVWMVPVWVFELKFEITHPTQETLRGNDMIVVLNAIDGGYIQPRIDSRIIVP